MSKAYYRVEWKFLEVIMRKLDFEEGLCFLDKERLSIVSYSLMIYGHKILVIPINSSL